MKTKIKFASGLFIALLLTFCWACKKDDNNEYPPGQSTITDPRDGKVYKTITTDSLTWFAENLDFDTAGAFEPPLKLTTGAKLGKLYAFGSAKVACPSGWHLSTDNEWKALLMHLGVSAEDAGSHGWNGGDAGKKLKSTTGWSGNGNGTNLIGFGALPAGWMDYYGEHKGKGEYAVFWTSTLEQDNAAYTRSLVDSRDDMGKTAMTYTGGAAASVRCVKDAPK